MRRSGCTRSRAVKKNGLDVNLVFIPGGPNAAAAMIAGEVQAMAMAGPPSSPAISPVQIS